MPEMTDNLLKEMHACFGEAYAASENLCMGLGIIYSLLSFQTAGDATTPRIEEKQVEARSLTLGQLIVRVTPLVSENLKERLNEALKMRNYMAHQFWYEQVFEMFDDGGINTIIEQLNTYREFFDTLDRELMAIVEARLAEFGMTSASLEEHQQKLMAGEKERPLPSKKPLSKTTLRITHAYNVPVDNNRIALVFETQEGELLQFCDVGLGWSNFVEVQPNWEINEALQPYLPANLTPRPDIQEPWNYEFKLPKSAILWVTRGKREKSFKFGIKNDSKKLSTLD